ncbi:hypothetical protein JCM3765_006109 [Sporobolomyces pararoseus]
MNKTELPSIYTALPILPPVSSQYDPQLCTSGERESTLQLSQLAQQGPANYVLRQTLLNEREREETKRRYRERYDREVGIEGASGSEGPPRRKRGRPRSNRGWSSTGAEGGDDEKTEADYSTGGDRKRLKGKKHLQHKSRHHSEIPRLAKEIPPSDPPQNFPSGSLLFSIHLHASHLFASNNSLLPPLTSEAPLLPPHLLTHFNKLSNSLNTQEESLLKQEGLSLKQLGQIRENRLGKVGRGSRKGVWTNVEKKFDSSALVALGMLTKLLVEDALQPPRIEISEHFPAPQQIPTTQADLEPQRANENSSAENSGGRDADFELPIPPPQFTNHFS